MKVKTIDSLVTKKLYSKLMEGRLRPLPGDPDSSPITPQEFSKILETKENTVLGESVERNFKEIEEYVKQFGKEAKHCEPFFLTKDGAQPKGEDIAPGDTAVFTGSLHTVDKNGYLVDDDTGLLAGPGGFHWNKNDPTAKPYLFWGKLEKQHHTLAED